MHIISQLHHVVGFCKFRLGMLYRCFCLLHKIFSLNPFKKYTTKKESPAFKDVEIKCYFMDFQIEVTQKSTHCELTKIARCKSNFFAYLLSTGFRNINKRVYHDSHKSKCLIEGQSPCNEVKCISGRMKFLSNTMACNLMLWNPL